MTVVGESLLSDLLKTFLTQIRVVEQRLGTALSLPIRFFVNVVVLRDGRRLGYSAKAWDRSLAVYPGP